VSSPAAPTTPEKPPRRLVAWWRNLDRSVKAVAGLAAAIAAILGLVFLLWPDLRPDPTPDAASVEFTRLSVDHPVTRAQSLDRPGLPHTGFTAEQLAERGAFVSFDLSVKGYGGRRLPVRWLLLDAAGDLVGSQDRRILLAVDRNDVTLTHRYWTGVPPAGGPFRAVLEVYPPGTKPGDPATAPLRTRESDPFPAA
jgi:hypothetical protein